MIFGAFSYRTWHLIDGITNVVALFAFLFVRQTIRINKIKKVDNKGKKTNQKENLA